MPAYLLDTNCILRWRDVHNPVGAQVREAIAQIGRQNSTAWVTPQNLIEFWSVATRPASVNGLGLTPVQAEQEIVEIERRFTLLPDAPEIYREWRRLVLRCGVSGRQVHDARLAAVMNAYGIRHMLTLNTEDFRRYPGIVPVHPSELASSTP